MNNARTVQNDQEVSIETEEVSVVQLNNFELLAISGGAATVNVV